MIKHLIRASMRSGVQCPDCKRGTITRYDRCNKCGLSWEDIEVASSFLDDHATKGKKK